VLCLAKYDNIITPSLDTFETIQNLLKNYDEPRVGRWTQIPKKKHWQARIAFLQLLPLANIFHYQNQHFQKTRCIFWREEEGFCYLFLFGILFFLGFLFIYALILFTGLNVVSMF